MFEMHLISGITDGWQGWEPTTCQAKCRNRAPTYSLYFGMYYSFGFSRLVFFCIFWGVFW